MPSRPIAHKYREGKVCAPWSGIEWRNWPDQFLPARSPLGWVWELPVLKHGPRIATTRRVFVR